MTVEDLIFHLNQLPGDLPVLVHAYYPADGDYIEARLVTRGEMARDHGDIFVDRKRRCQTAQTADVVVIRG